MHWRDAFLRLRALTLRTRVERDLEDELTFHIEMETRKNIAAGMTEAEAARRARVEFGGASKVQEECRDARRIGFVETLWQDLRYAIRGFRRSPTFVLTVVGTIGLGLGLNTALFTIFNATYFRPIDVRDPQALYEFFWIDRSGAGHDFSYPEYTEFLSSNPAFSEALAYHHAEARLEGRPVLGTLVTGDYFRMLGVGTILGRTLLPEDSRQSVVVLSYRAWQTRFLADPEIIGKKIILRGYPFEVVGVARAGFAGLASRPADFWAPLTMADVFGVEQPRSVSIVGRLHPDFSARQAQAGVTIWAQRLTSEAPDQQKAVQATLISRATTKPLNVKNALAFSPILVAFSLILLIGCANVANMMLARSISRRREIGIRLSLGAARGRLIRQLLTESILLAIPAAIAGLAVSQAAIRVSVRVLIATLPAHAADFTSRIPDLTSDLRVFGFTLAGAVLSAILFGLAPAIQATRVNVIQAVTGSVAGSIRPSRLRSTLVIGQVTVCVVLLVTAGILLRGADRIHRLDAELSTRNTINIIVQEKNRESTLRRLSAEPIIDTIAAAASAPVERKLSMQTSAGLIAGNNVSPEYFTLFEIPILRGRNFTNDEARSGAAVAVISQTTAQRLWPDQDAIGRTLRVSMQARPIVTVVGIARDEISRWIGSGEDKALLYFPTTAHAAGNELFVTVHGDFEIARRKIESDLTALDPNIRKMQIREWVEDDTYYSLRIAYWLSSAVGILALILTLSGTYGVLSYVISQRTKEIGVRMAMGATTRSVTGLVLKQSMRLAITGALAGAVLAMGVSKLLASALIAINAFDAVAYLGGITLVLSACAAAAYFPSRRASRIDPLSTLRHD